MGDKEYNTNFNWDIALEHGYDWNDITSNGETVVHNVGKKYEKNKSNIYNGWMYSKIPKTAFRKTI